MHRTIPSGQTDLLDNENSILSDKDFDCLLEDKNIGVNPEKIPFDEILISHPLEVYHRSSNYIITKLSRCFNRRDNPLAFSYVRKTEELNKWVKNYAENKIAKRNNSSSLSERSYKLEIISKPYISNTTTTELNENINYAKSKQLQSGTNREESIIDQVESNKKGSCKKHETIIENGVKDYRTNNSMDKESFALEFSKNKEDNNANENFKEKNQKIDNYHEKINSQEKEGIHGSVYQK